MDSLFSWMPSARFVYVLVFMGIDDCMFSEDDSSSSSWLEELSCYSC